MIRWWLYPLRADETFLRFGDYYGSAPLFNNPSYYRPLAYIATRYKNPYARWFAEQFRLRRRGWSDELNLLLFPSSDENTPRAKPPTDLPRTHFAQRMGTSIARGDWDLKISKVGEPIVGARGGTVAAFKCSPYYLHNHCHRDANSIVIYHKGDLAIDSGTYDGYESPHWYNYYVRTIAHNTIVVHDPQEKFISRGHEFANDGGQRFINDPSYAAHDISELKNFRDGTIVKQFQRKMYSYVCGDASNCYHKNKLTKFLRHVTFLLDYPHKSAVSLLVLDEIELARDGLTPRFLLHSMDEPAISGNTVTIVKGQGKLTATFLTPTKLEPIGGDGKDFWVDGANYPPRREAQPHLAPGRWRVEASPAEPGRKFEMVTLLTPTDLEAAVPEPATVRRAGNSWIVEQGGLTVGLYRGKAPGGLKGARRVVVEIGA